MLTSHLKLNLSALLLIFGCGHTDVKSHVRAEMVLVIDLAKYVHFVAQASPHGAEMV